MKKFSGTLDDVDVGDDDDEKPFPPPDEDAVACAHLLFFPFVTANAGRRRRGRALGICSDGRLDTDNDIAIPTQAILDFESACVCVCKRTDDDAREADDDVVLTVRALCTYSMIHDMRERMCVRMWMKEAHEIREDTSILLSRSQRWRLS